MKKKFGELAIEAGLLTQKDVEYLLFMQQNELLEETRTEENVSRTIEVPDTVTILTSGEAAESFVAKQMDQTQRYKVLKVLGEGGMGVVQLVRDEWLGREVALKRVRLVGNRKRTQEKHQLQRLKREAEFLALLEHPNIVPLYEMQTKGAGEIQFTMKKVDGQTFRSVLKQVPKGREGERKLLGILLKVCDGIHYAHSKGIIHRDLKPDNIMVGNYGEVYILDWGIAKKTKEQNHELDLGTRSLEIAKTRGGLGTPGYMPPEQQHLASEVTEKADVYSLGKILKECYTKLSPWEEIRALQESYKQLFKTEKTLSIRDLKNSSDRLIPKEIQAILKKATAEKPMDRYPEIKDFLQDIENYLKGIPVSAKEYRLDELIQKWVLRNSKGLVLFGMFFLGLMLLFGSLKWSALQREQRLIEEREHLHQRNYHAGKTTKIQGDQIQTTGRSGRESKIKSYLDALSFFNHALMNKPQEIATEQAKIETITILLPLCYQEEDYQLASYLARDLQTVTRLDPKEKKGYLDEVTTKKNKMVTEHLNRFASWKQKYFATDPKNGLQAGDRDDFLFEIAQMKEEELLAELLLEIEQGKKYFLENHSRTTSQTIFYQDVVKVVGRLGNIKASEKLLDTVNCLYRQIELLDIEPTPDEIRRLQEEILPDSLTQQLRSLVESQKNLWEEPLFLIKIAPTTWILKNNQKEWVYKIVQVPLNKTLQIYSCRKDNDLEYVQFLCEVVIALGYLQDPSSVSLLLKIAQNRAINKLFSQRMEPLLKKIKVDFSQEKDSAFIAQFKMLQEDWIGAIDAYTQSIQLDPTESFFYLNRGVSKEKIGDLAGALEDYNQAIQFNSQFPEAFFNRGCLRKLAGDLDGAILDFTQSLLLHSQFVEAYVNRGVSKDLKNDFEGAITDLNKAIEINPQYFAAYNARGAVREKKGDFPGAIDDYNKTLELNPDWFAPYLNRGVVKKNQGKLEEAIADYNRALALNPQCPYAYCNRGNAKLEKEDSTGAILDFTEEIKINPKNPIAFWCRGIAKQKQKKLDEAIVDYDQAVALNPSHSLTYYDRGNAKKDQKNFKEALADYTKALELDPHLLKGYVNRGVVHDEMGNLEEALNDYTQALVLDPKLSAIYVNRGTLWKKLEENDQALADYNKALDLDPQRFEAYINRGDVKRTRGDVEGAIQDYSQVIALNPEYSEAYLARGIGYSEKKDFSRAILDFTKAIHWNPQYVEAYDRRGNAKKAINDLEGAIADYTTAIELKPDFAEAYMNRGNLKRMKKDLDGALADYNTGISLSPNLFIAYYNRALIKQSKGLLEDAITDFTETIRLSPQFSFAYYNRGFCQRSLQHRDEAIEDFEKGLLIDADSEVLPQFIELLKQRSRIRFSEKEWAGAKNDILKIKQYLPPEDPQHQGLDQKIRQLDQKIQNEKKD